MVWRAEAAASTPIRGGAADVSSFLDSLADSDFIVRADDSVVSCEPAARQGGGGGGEGEAGRYVAAIAPLRLPGLTVRPTAFIRVDRLSDGGLRYTTERVDNAFEGSFRGLAERVTPTITAATTLRAEERRLWKRLRKEKRRC